jgi:hypothetical protein
MPRHEQILRQWRLLLALSDREWFSIDELRDCLPRPRPHRRTILRDMEALTAVFPIQRRGRRGASDKFEFQLRRPLASWLEKR